MLDEWYNPYSLPWGFRHVNVEGRGLAPRPGSGAMAKSKRASYKAGNGANLGFEATLWAAADKLRNNMDAAEYKHVVLGLVFLKYISDAFSERYEQLKLWADDPTSDYYVKDPARRYDALEDRDEYTGENVFWVPQKARWTFLQDNARQPTIGQLVDEAMEAIERENPVLKGVLPKDYARPALDKTRLGELIDLIGTVGLGDKANRSKDILGRVHEYFLGRFASAEGKRGGEFYTPRCIVQVLVEMLAPYKGRVFDPCCGSGGMFVQSEGFVEAHGGQRGDISVYGQESNPTSWRPMASRALCWPTAPCRPTPPARARSARPSSRRTSWTAWSPCPGSFSTPRRSRCACGSSPAIRGTAASATGGARRSSSTRGSSAGWWTACTAS